MSIEQALRQRGDHPREREKPIVPTKPRTGMGWMLYPFQFIWNVLCIGTSAIGLLCASVIALTVGLMVDRGYRARLFCKLRRKQARPPKPRRLRLVT